MRKGIRVCILLCLLCLLMGCGKLTKINELINQGNEAYKKEDYAAAIEAFTAVLELDDERELVFNNRGMAYMNQGSYEKAVADFSSAIKINDKEDVYFYNRGLTYLAQEKWSEAEKDFTQALSLRTDVIYYISRGDARKALGEADKAIEDYGEALAQEPGNMIALNNRGALYFAAGDYEKAIADYTQALQQEGLSKEDETTLYWNRAEAHRLMESYETAALDYEVYLEKTGREDVSALTCLAQCQEVQGLYEEATETYSRLIAAEPENMAAYQGRADAFYQLKRYSEAAQDYTVTLTAKEDYVNYAFRGYCYYAVGEYDRALEDLTASITINENYAWAYYVRSNVYKEKSEYKAAQADLEKAIELEKTASE